MIYWLALGLAVVIVWVVEQSSNRLIKGLDILYEKLEDVSERIDALKLQLDGIEAQGDRTFPY